MTDERAGNALRAGRVGPPDGAVGDLQSHIKAAPCPRLAIHDSSGLRGFTRKRTKKKVFPWLPEPSAHQASAMRADVARNGPLGKTRLVHCCEMHGDNRRRALLNSSVEKQLATSERWSKRVHSRVLPPGERNYRIESDGSVNFPHCFHTIWVQKGESRKRLHFIAGNYLSTVRFPADSCD